MTSDDDFDVLEWWETTSSKGVAGFYAQNYARTGQYKIERNKTLRVGDASMGPYGGWRDEIAWSCMYGPYVGKEIEVGVNVDPEKLKVAAAAHHTKERLRAVLVVLQRPYWLPATAFPEFLKDKEAKRSKIWLPG